MKCVFVFSEVCDGICVPEEKAPLVPGFTEDPAGICIQGDICIVPGTVSSSQSYYDAIFLTSTTKLTKFKRMYCRNHVMTATAIPMACEKTQQVHAALNLG